ncbi:MAG: hypothetical protein F9K25_17895 [Candidatus Contendobacter sp.]|nr:MAG: hypothetical protein F9K25_17895 [Candidatus Contendobacter sp.]
MKPLHQLSLSIRGKTGAFVYQRVGKGRGNIPTQGHHDLQLRRHVIPTNYRTEPQQQSRRRIGAATAAWRGLQEHERDHWRDRARPQRRTGFNLFVRDFCRRHPVEAF